MNRLQRRKFQREQRKYDRAMLESEEAGLATPEGQQLMSSLHERGFLVTVQAVNAADPDKAQLAPYVEPLETAPAEDMLDDLNVVLCDVCRTTADADDAVFCLMPPKGWPRDVQMPGEEVGMGLMNRLGWRIAGGHTRCLDPLMQERSPVEA